MILFRVGVALFLQMIQSSRNVLRETGFLSPIRVRVQAARVRPWQRLDKHPQSLTSPQTFLYYLLVDAEPLAAWQRRIREGETDSSAHFSEEAVLQYLGQCLASY